MGNLGNENPPASFPCAEDELEVLATGLGRLLPCAYSSAHSHGNFDLESETAILLTQCVRQLLEVQVQEELRSARLASCPVLGLNRSEGLAQFSLSLPAVLGRLIMM